MIDTVYVEDGVRDQSRTQAILARFPRATRIACRRYTEIFNPSAQSFRLQKRRPALILAEKRGNLVLETPVGYGIGGHRNYYFSHMLNCVYDCRYCFLQGMVRSAHYVLFVNYDDFQRQILETLRRDPDEPTYFFAGYDCDSLALESITGFVREFLPVFRRRPQAILELRTKSVQIRELLRQRPLPNCVVAYSLAPTGVAEALEHGAPSLDRRVKALVKLGKRGWKLGLRFDPLIFHDGYQHSYRELFATVFQRLPRQAVHSVTLGALRFPQTIFKRLVDQYPEEPLLARKLNRRQRMVSYPEELEAEMMSFCRHRLQDLVPSEKIFCCAVESLTAMAK